MRFFQTASVTTKEIHTEQGRRGTMAATTSAPVRTDRLDSTSATTGNLVYRLPTYTGDVFYAYMTDSFPDSLHCR